MTSYLLNLMVSYDIINILTIAGYLWKLMVSYDNLDKLTITGYLWTVVVSYDTLYSLKIVGDPWTLWSVTGNDTGDGTDNAVELVLYGDKGHSKPVIIGAATDFQFSEGQADKFDVS